MAKKSFDVCIYEVAKMVWQQEADSYEEAKEIVAKEYLKDPNEYSGCFDVDNTFFGRIQVVEEDGLVW